MSDRSFPDRLASCVIDDGLGEEAAEAEAAFEAIGDDREIALCVLAVVVGFRRPTTAALCKQPGVDDHVLARQTIASDADGGREGGGLVAGQVAHGVSYAEVRC